ncbi:hypothetical protein IEE83_09440 [Dyadobacter sp. UP-52]|uniref:Uncharacterized protein n=2 Tax=Dyadobacter subterraneus TaxID=2773304 RepID=A0ABR9W9E4_9BACT|nr:hypothetical protein [Dyadobacter subterraneus]
MGAWPILRKATDPALRGGEYLGLCSLTKDHMMWILPNGSGHYLNLQLSSRIISRSWLTANHLSNQFHFRMHRFMGVPRPMHPLISVMELDTVKISV